MAERITTDPVETYRMVDDMSILSPGVEVHEGVLASVAGIAHLAVLGLGNIVVDAKKKLQKWADDISMVNGPR